MCRRLNVWLAATDAGAPSRDSGGSVMNEVLALEKVQLLATASLPSHLATVQGPPAQVNC